MWEIYLPFGDDSYYPFIVILKIIYYWVFHIIDYSNPQIYLPKGIAA